MHAAIISHHVVKKPARHSVEAIVDKQSKLHVHLFFSEKLFLKEKAFPRP